MSESIQKRWHIIHLSVLVRLSCMHKKRFMYLLEAQWWKHVFRSLWGIDQLTKKPEGELNLRLIPYVEADVLLCAYSAAEEEMQAESVARRPHTTTVWAAWFHLPPLLSSSPTAFQCFSSLPTFINFLSLPCSPSRNLPPSDHICLLLWPISHTVCWLLFFTLHLPSSRLLSHCLPPCSLTVCIFNLLVLLSSLHSSSLFVFPFMFVSLGWTAPCDWQVEMLNRNHLDVFEGPNQSQRTVYVVKSYFLNLPFSNHLNVRRQTFLRGHSVQKKEETCLVQDVLFNLPFKFYWFSCNKKKKAENLVNAHKNASKN